MSDEVDDLLRRAMTTLDHQVPEGYFDTLASRTVARLDDPAIGDLRDDLGDLGDLGDLEPNAPPASSSPGWKAVALPEAAKPLTVSGPDEVDDIGDTGNIDELARARAMRQAGAHASDPGAVAPATAQAVSLPDRQARANRRPLLTMVGLGLAAAAAAMIFVSTRAGTASHSEQALVARERDEASMAPMSRLSSTVTAANGASAGAPSMATPTGTVASGATTPVPEPAVSAHTGSSARGDQIAQIAADTPPSVAKPADPAVQNDVGAFRAGKTSPKGGGKGGAFTYEPKKINDSMPSDIPSGGPPGKPGPRDGKIKVGKKGTPLGSDTGEPSKSLSTDDFQRGMTAVAAKVRACFGGEAGRATVQLTVAPSGQVQKVTVTGAFAGTPAGTCVERAVKAAAFPAWDGVPASFGYDFSLSE